MIIANINNCKNIKKNNNLKVKNYKKSQNSFSQKLDFYR